MKVLSLHQPWASLIALGVKTIETRSWSAPTSLVGQRIAIHAAAKRPTKHGVIGDHRYDRYDDEWYMRPRDQRYLNHWGYLPLGAIVATARLARCVPMASQSDCPGPPCKGHPRHVCIDPQGGDESVLDVTHLHDIARNITAQRPYGDFRPGRFAWMLEDVQRLDEPVPFKGGQALSRSWEPA
jgi:hypothetical protein